MSDQAFALAVSPDLIEAIAQRVAELLNERGDAAASPWLTAKEAADYLRIPLSRLRKLTAAAAIPHVKEDGRVFYHRSDLDAWRNAVTCASTSPGPTIGGTQKMPRQRRNAPGPAQEV